MQDKILVLNGSTRFQRSKSSSDGEARFGRCKVSKIELSGGEGALRQE